MSDGVPDTWNEVARLLEKAGYKLRAEIIRNTLTEVESDILGIGMEDEDIAKYWQDVAFLCARVAAGEMRAVDDAIEGHVREEEQSPSQGHALTDPAMQPGGR